MKAARESTRVLVLADTHLRPGLDRRLPDAVYRALDDTDLIFHAGDVLVGDVLNELAGFAPVHAVLGNNDRELVGVLPEKLEIEVAGVRVGLIHDTGPSAGRARRVRRLFPACDLVVFGHSHMPIDAEGVDRQRLFNPGSPTERRMAPTRTFGILEMFDGRCTRRDILDC